MPTGWRAGVVRAWVPAMLHPESLYDRKRAIRRLALARRDAQPDKDQLSTIIWRRFAAQTEYARAGTLLLYVHYGSEVRTQPFLAEVMESGKRVVVPYCVGAELELFDLKELGELAIGRFGILEPRAELRGLVERRVGPEELDLAMVPGVAFDPRGGRIGHGKGFYDRLLARLRPDVLAVAVAFQCQMFPEVPMSEYDVFMDRVITETGLYLGRGRVDHGARVRPGS